MRYAGIGFEILACILLFLGAGYWLDQQFELEKPWFMITFVVLGALVAMYLMYKSISRH